MIPLFLTTFGRGGWLGGAEWERSGTEAVCRTSSKPSPSGERRSEREAVLPERTETSTRM